MKKNLVLTGMMGVGKSTIGQDLASKLDMQFKDIDKIIEEKLSLSITDIFEKKGEGFFRKIEEEETAHHAPSGVEETVDDIVVVEGSGMALLNALSSSNNDGNGKK